MLRFALNFSLGYSGGPIGGHIVPCFKFVFIGASSQISTTILVTILGLKYDAHLALIVIQNPIQ